jgi:RimJ/RimL family protein N-acetyltransferase
MDLHPEILTGDRVRLEPITPAQRDGLRRALDCDPETWAILTQNGQEDFDQWWADATGELAAGARIPFAVRDLAHGEIVGTTSYLNIRPVHRGVEIGWTFYRLDARGGAVNPACKRMLLAHAFDAGAVRVELCVDARNLRSQAACLKLGAVREGVLRQHKLTWTGHQRDTVMFSVLAQEWPAVRETLNARLA